MGTSNRSSDHAFLFYGVDDFSIRRKLTLWQEEFWKKHPAAEVLTVDAEKLSEAELLQRLDDALAPSLFSDKKLIICKNCFPTKAGQEGLAASLIKLIEHLPADYFLVFWQAKLDRRLASVKQLLQAPLKLTAFQLPHAQQLEAWLRSEVTREGATIEPSALELLAVYLGRDLFEKNQEVFNLWQAHNEVVKLASHSPQITVKAVGDLVTPKIPQNIFALADQIMAGQKQAATQTMMHLLETQASDQKTEIIRLVALLAEQFRALATVSLLSAKPPAEIAELLGWSPGRVFINLKLAKQVSMEKLVRFLRDLLAIDQKLKTSDSNPRLLLDMFVHKS